MSTQTGNPQSAIRNPQSILCATLVLCVASSALLAAPAPAAKWRVETADARVIVGQLESVAGGMIVIRGDSGAQELPMADVVEMSAGEQPEDIMAIPGQAVLETACGDALAVSDVSYDGKKLAATGKIVGGIEMPIDSARAILLPSVGRSCSELLKGYEQMGLGKPTGDRLVVTREALADLAVDGVLEGIDAAKVTFRWAEESRTVARKSVPMIFLAEVAAKAETPAGTLVTRDSSRIRFRSIQVEGGKITVDSLAAGKLTVKLADAVSVRLASEQVVRLTDLKPSAVKEQGLFDLAFTHRQNKSVGGRALTMGGRQYATGLGLHSYCELEYDLEAKFSTFVAVVGIDDEVRPHGDAAVSFLIDGKAAALLGADGKALSAKDGADGEAVRVTGKDEPRQIRVDVRGARKLTIRVDFGRDGLGVGDHVDVVGARLIR